MGNEGIAPAVDIFPGVGGAGGPCLTFPTLSYEREKLRRLSENTGLAPHYVHVYVRACVRLCVRSYATGWYIFTQ